MPRGLIAGMVILLVFAALMLLFGAGRRRAPRRSRSPTTRCRWRSDAATAATTWLGGFVNYVGLAGLVASFFSIVFAYSRQLFALSRAGYLPRSCR